MLLLPTSYYAGLIITLAAVTAIGLFSFTRVKTAEDLTVGGRKLLSSGVAGAIVGSFAGGTVTIGTAQMAFQYGVGAIWFTAGAGVSCLLLSLFLAGPLRRKEVFTVTEYLVDEYGKSIRLWVALFTVIGMLIQVAVQVMAAVPVFTGIIPVAPAAAAVITILLIMFYIIGGGIWSTSMVGMIKLVLLSICLFTGGVISFLKIGGLHGALTTLPAVPDYFSLFPRGAAVELGGFLSVIVGFTSTQAFLQPLFAGRDVKSARLGALGAAVIIPLYGLAGAAIGLLMKAVSPNINPSSALPVFFNTQLSPWLGGVANATLLISLVLTGGALTLGISTVMTRDIYLSYRAGITPRKLLLVSRLFMLLVGAFVLVFVLFSLNSLILDWSYLSNALRGAAVFLPLLGAVFLPGRIKPARVYRAVLFGPVATLLWALFSPLKIHPLFAGLPVALICLLPGLYSRKLKHK